MDGREEEYQLAGPYLYTRRVFVVKKDSDIRELSDLVGKTIALQAGSIAGVRILVVEDNELNMEIAEYMFTERGAVVEKAADGKKALEMFAASEEGYYDVIMMDIMMPEMDVSLFSLAAAMETVENRKRFSHRSHSLLSPSFSSLTFSPYREKFSFLLQERAVTVMGRAQYVNTA